MLRTMFHNVERRFPRMGLIARRLILGEEVRGLRRSIQGKENMLEANGVTFTCVTLDIIGDRNQIVIGEGSVLCNLRIRIRGSDNRIELGKNCRLTQSGQFWIEDDHCLLMIGEHTTMVECSMAATEPGSKMIVGQDCMFANDIDIRTGDSHTLLDVSTGQRINFARDVTIHDHVWIAAHSVILKGVSIGENSVVASGTVVTCSCEPGSILAGNPAKVIKTGVNWKRERINKCE